MSAQIPKPVGVLGALAGLVGFSALAGLLVTAMVTPALAVTSMTAKSTVSVFEDLPDYLEFGKLTQRNTLWATQGGQPVKFAEIYDQNREEVTWDEVSSYAKDAAVAGEDERFFEHGGVDLAGIARAAVNNLSGARTQGASTLTQQLVKNILIANALSSDGDEDAKKAAIAAAQDDSLQRKLREAKLAIGLEKNYTKQEILLGYLNIAGFGGNTYGIESAAQLYYSTTAKDLTVAQAASLVAIVQNPNYQRLDYPENWESNRVRRDAILGNMLEQEKIDQTQYDEAIATPIDETTVKIAEPRNGCLYATAAKQFCDYVLGKVKTLEALGANEDERKANWKTGGYNLYTPIDLDQQANAEAVLAEQAPATESRFELGAASSVVQVGTGRILAMAQNKGFNNVAVPEGGTPDPTTTSLNFNTDFADGGSGGFQPGSSYKLFTLINWLQNGHGLREIVDGNSRTYTNKTLKAKCAPGNEPYTVRNDLGVNRGRISVLQATAGSVNAAFYSMASKLDLCDIRDTAKSMGVHRADGKELETYAPMVLGTDTVAPLTMANAYATVSSGGILCQPIAVDKIVDADGNELAGQPQDCNQVIEPEIAAAAAEALQGVMRSGGTGSKANPNDGTELIGKTGTADALSTFLVSASTKIASAVWVGNIKGDQDLRRINVGQGKAADLRYPIAKSILASFDASPYGVDAPDFPEPPRSLLKGSNVAVPNIAGQSVDAARKLLEGLGFDFDQGATVASEFPAGQVVSTNPGAGTLSSKGARVEVLTSDGSLATSVPNVAGQSQTDAVNALATAGFDPATVTITYAEGDPNGECTVTASDPPAGTTTSKTAAITLTVNSGDKGESPDCA